MTSLRNLPLKRKLTAIILGTCTLALGLACLVLFVIQSFQFQREFTRDLESVAKIMAHNTLSAAIGFSDKDTAKEILAAMQAKPRILGAHIHLADGELFASYGSDAVAIPEQPLTERGAHRVGRYLLVAQPILADSKPIAMLHVWADYAGEHNRLLGVYLATLVAVLCGSLLVAYIISHRLQALITQPLLQLTSVSRSVADKNDYTIRAAKAGRDEVGELTDAFNQMLDKIQVQDQALQQAQEKLTRHIDELECEITKRQKVETALQFSRLKFVNLVNSLEGIVWEFDLQAHCLSFVSRQCERLLGYPQSQWTTEPDFLLNHICEADRKRVRELLAEAVQNHKPLHCEFRMEAADGRTVWMRSSASVVAEQGRAELIRGVLLDVTEQKEAEQKMARQKELMDASRQAGMAEIATGVLHNVGNVLNSINVSTTLLRDRLRRTRLPNLGRAIGLMREQGPNLSTYLASDPKGKLLPEYLAALNEHLQQENQQLSEELDMLVHNVDHVKEIVAMQQSYAKAAGMTEILPPVTIIEDAVQMNAAEFQRHGIQVVKDYQPVPKVMVDRHKILQILMNLLRNAKQSMVAANPTQKQLVLSVSSPQTNQVRIAVRDNGVGISPENLTRIFQYGFTTKKNGHGFGLHSGALAAKQMGGALKVHSDGEGQGATFALELRAHIEEQAA